MVDFPTDLVEQGTKFLTSDFTVMSEITKFKEAKENELSQYHFTLGMFYRNHYDLWDSKKVFYEDEDRIFTVHPDDVSMYFVREFHEQLTEDNFVKI